MNLKRRGRREPARKGIYLERGNNVAPGSLFSFLARRRHPLLDEFAERLYYLRAAARRSVRYHVQTVQKGKLIA